MLLYWILFIIIIAFALRNWRKTIIVWLPIQLLFNECVCLKYTSPSVTFVLAVNAVFLFLYLFKKDAKKLNSDSYFFKKAFIVYGISYFLSLLFSIVPFHSIFLNTVKYFIQTYLIMMVFQKALCSIDDIKLYVRTSFIVICLITLLGVYESSLKDNPILNYVYVNAPTALIEGKMYYAPPFLKFSGELTHRFNLVRCYSFFGIHIEYGCTCLLLLYLYLYFLRSKNYILKKNFIILSILFLILGVLLSNSKTPLIGLFFILLAFYKLKDILNLRLIIVFIICVTLVIFYAPGYLNNIIAIFDQNMADEGGGSSTAMRARQFEIGLELFLQNPLFGNGIGSIAEFMKNYNNAELYGSESSWLKVLIERGVVGVLSYIYLYTIMFKGMRKYLPLKMTLFFLLGLLAMETATGFMNFALYGSIIIVICKYVQLSRKRDSNY